MPGIVNSLGATALVRIVNVCVVALSAVLFARTLGAKDYGVLTTILSAATILAVCLALGLGMLVAREIAGALATGASGSTTAIIAKATRCFVVANTPVLLIVLLAAAVWPDSVLTLGVAATLGVGIAGLTVAAGIYRGFNRPAMAAFLMGVIRPLTTAGITLGTIIVFGSLGLNAVMTIHVLSAAISLLIAAYLIWRLIDVSNPSQPEAPAWASSQVGFVGLGLVQAASGNIEPVLLSTFSDETQVGFFRLAFLAGFVCQTPISLLSAVLLPKIAALWAGRHLQELSRVVRKAAACAVIVSIPINVFAAFAMEWAIPVLFGAEFSAAVFPATLFVLFMAPYSAVAMAGSILAMTGSERSAIVCIMIGYAVNITIIAIFSREYGASAAILGSALGSWTLCMMMHRVIRAKLGLSCLPSISDVLHEIVTIRATLRTQVAFVTGRFRGGRAL